MYLKPVKPSAHAHAAAEQLLDALFAQRLRPPCPCGKAARRTVLKVEKLGPSIMIDLHLRCAACARELEKASTEQTQIATEEARGAA